MLARSAICAALHRTPCPLQLLAKCSGIALTDHQAIRLVEKLPWTAGPDPLGIFGAKIFRGHGNI